MQFNSLSFNKKTQHIMCWVFAFKLPDSIYILFRWINRASRDSLCSLGTGFPALPQAGRPGMLLNQKTQHYCAGFSTLSCPTRART